MFLMRLIPPVTRGRPFWKFRFFRIVVTHDTQTFKFTGLLSQKIQLSVSSRAQLEAESSTSFLLLMNVDAVIVYF